MAMRPNRDSPATLRCARCPAALAVVIAIAGALPAARTWAQTSDGFTVIGGNVQERANGVLTLMAFSVAPDVTAGSLEINSARTDNPSITLVQCGSGFIFSSSFPLYLEGFVGFNRYDPTFVASNGQEERQVPTKWNTVTGTGGIGWDFPVPFIDNVRLRPIFNFSLGHVASDSAVAGRLIGLRTDRQLDFLDDGRLNAYGLGGAVVLDVERYREAYELDVELRYTNINLQSFGDTSDAAQGSVDAETLSFWSRWRQPTGLIALRKPLRYVLELSNTTYLGDQAGVLGFNYLTALGGGFELDTSGINLIFTRVRFMARYLIGENVMGVSGGISATWF
jgi:hypothetical protein